jgi:hypothetical protein
LLTLCSIATHMRLLCCFRESSFLEKIVVFIIWTCHHDSAAAAAMGNVENEIRWKWEHEILRHSSEEARIIIFQKQEIIQHIIPFLIHLFLAARMLPVIIIRRACFFLQISLSWNFSQQNIRDTRRLSGQVWRNGKSINKQIKMKSFIKIISEIFFTREKNYIISWNQGLVVWLLSFLFFHTIIPPSRVNHNTKHTNKDHI